MPAPRRLYLSLPCRHMRPTKRHRPAVWENMLGTVYARNAAGVVKYFDYNHAAALQYSGATSPAADPRTWRAPRTPWARGVDEPRPGKLALYILDVTE